MKVCKQEEFEEDLLRAQLQTLGIHFQSVRETQNNPDSP